MTMTFDIPAEVQSEVVGIPGLDMRVALFLRHEAQLERVRRERHSAEAREIAERAMRGAEADKAAGRSREDAFAEFRKLHTEVTEQL